MRVKNVLIGFAGVITLFTACSEEIPIVDSHAGSFSISFSADPITLPTKGGTQEATSEERKVNSCFIGFFELNNGLPGKMIKGDRYDLTATPKALDNEYHVNDIILPEDKTDEPVHILVIANPPAGKPKDEYSSYFDFTDIIHGKGIVSYSDAASFAASSLIKVGEIDYDFSKGKTASVDLRQLAAKVLISFSLDKEVEMSDITVGVDNVALNSPLLITPETSFEESLGVLGAQSVDMTAEKMIDYTFYTYQKEYANTIEDMLTVQVKGRFPNSSNDVIYKAIISPASSDTSTEGVLGGNCYKATATLKVNDSFETKVNWVVVDIEKVEEINIPRFD